MTDHHLSELGDRLDLSKVVKKTDCQELLEVHQNVIYVKSIAFLMIFLAPEVSFVILHMRWHKNSVLTASTTSETISDSAECYGGLSVCFESSAACV